MNQITSKITKQQYFKISDESSFFSLFICIYFTFLFCRSGIHFTSFTCEPLLLLPYLYKKLIQAGVRIENKRIESFDELKSFDLIINCAGLGAQMLIKNDVKLQPIRGQVIRIRAPWIFEVMLDDSQNGNYIIPK